MSTLEFRLSVLACQAAKRKKQLKVACFLPSSSVAPSRVPKFHLCLSILGRSNNWQVRGVIIVSDRFTCPK